MIALFTDFGLEGPYIGQVKAALIRLAPEVPVIDLLADAPAFAPELAAYLLRAYSPGFEAGDIVVAVVDPGVGSERRGLAMEADGRFFVGPDNGLFELVRRDATRFEAVDLEPDAGASATFHGRDVFAPAAARIARAGRLEGAPLDVLRFPEWPDDLPRIVYVDRYGNAMTGMRAQMLPPSTRLEAGGELIARARTFADVPPGALLWYENANGLAEIAVNGGRAADRLGLTPGMPIAVQTGS